MNQQRNVTHISLRVGKIIIIEYITFKEIDNYIITITKKLKFTPFEFYEKLESQVWYIIYKTISLIM